MDSIDVSVPTLTGRALLHTPDDGVTCGAVVALHGAALPARDQPLFEHLARTLTPLGLAVMAYDRRPSVDGGDVPLADQAADASAALAWLEERYRLPVGLYGFSQGAWAACVVAAERSDLTWLALIGCSGVSPAVQMRFHTDEQLRRAGFDQSDRDQLGRLRLAMEDVLRGRGDREATGALLARAATRPWFPLAHLPPELPPEDFRWDDLDFDPAPVIARVGCPTLLVYGEQDEAVPVADSVRVWRRQGSRELTVTEIPGCGHLPTTSAPDDRPLTVEDIGPEYTDALRTFFGG